MIIVKLKIILKKISLILLASLLLLTSSCDANDPLDSLYVSELYVDGTQIDNIVRTATYVVAASDSTAIEKNQADVLCDGIADDVEIQTLFNSLNDGESIYFASGTYILSEGVELTNKDNVTIYGIGTLKLGVGVANADSNILIVSDSDYFNISGLILDGNKSNYIIGTNEETQNCLQVLNCDHVTITDVTAQNHWMSGIKIGGFLVADACDDVTISNCTVSNVYDQGIGIWKSSNVIVSSCTVNSGGWAGISLTHSDSCTVTNCISSNNVYTVNGASGEGSGIASEGSTNFIISDNITYGNNAVGILITWWWEDYRVSSNGHVSNNIVYGTINGIGIDLAHADGIEVINNDSCDNGGTGIGIQVQKDAINCVISYGTISGNIYGIICRANGTKISNIIFDGNTKEQIKITWDGSDSPINVSICSNTFINGTSYAQILLEGISYCEIIDNIIEETNGRGINCDLYGSTPCSNVTINGGLILSCTTDGIYFKGVTNSSISDVKIVSCQKGILIETGSHLLISGCDISLCTDRGLDARGLHYSDISSMQVYNNANQGIVFSDNGSIYCIYNRIMQCFLYDDLVSHNQSRGFEEIGNSDYNQIFFCTAYGNTDGQITIIGANSTSGNNVTW